MDWGPAGRAEPPQAPRAQGGRAEEATRGQETPHPGAAGTCLEDRNTASPRLWPQACPGQPPGSRGGLSQESVAPGNPGVSSSSCRYGAARAAVPGCCDLTCLLGLGSSLLPGARAALRKGPPGLGALAPVCTGILQEGEVRQHQQRTPAGEQAMGSAGQQRAEQVQEALPRAPLPSQPGPPQEDKHHAFPSLGRGGGFRRVGWRQGVVWEGGGLIMGVRV